MSDTNRVGLRYRKSTERVTPITLNPNSMKALRITGTPSMAFNPITVQTNEIRPDRQITDLILVGGSAGGDAGFELSYAAFDDFLESTMLSTWVNTPRKLGTTEITAFGAGTVTVDDASDFTANHVIRLDDVGGPDIGDGVYVVASIATNTLTLTPHTAGTNALQGTNTANTLTLSSVTGLIAASAGDLTIDVTGTVMSVIGPAGFFTDAMGTAENLAPGQWVKLNGFDTAANNVWLRVDTVSGTTITGAAPTGAVSETTAGTGVVHFGDYVRNGTDSTSDHSYAIERRFEDHVPTPSRELFLGMSPGQMSLSITPQQIMTGSITFQGFNSSIETDPAELYQGATPADLEAPQFSVMNSSNDVGRIGRGTDPVNAANKNFVLDASFNINNNLRERLAVGTLGAVEIRSGDFEVTGSLSTYFDDRNLLNDFFNNQETSFDMSVGSPDGRSVVFDLPRIKFEGGAPDVPGKNQDVVLPLTYRALRSKTLGYTMQIQRLAYAP